jgi:serine/threonine protein kinase
MGTVYRARDMHFSNAMKLVAVKEMINQTHDPGLRQTCFKLRARSKYPGLIKSPIHSKNLRLFLKSMNGTLWYWNIVDGKIWKHTCATSMGFIPEEQIIGWRLKCVMFWIFLHSHKPEPIIFRDVKTINRWSTGMDHIILIDFGNREKYSRSGRRERMIGTEGYPHLNNTGEAKSYCRYLCPGATLHHLLTKKDPRIEAPFTFSERPIRSLIHPSHQNLKQ